MSSRIRSEFGSLADRSAAAATRAELPAHAWVRFDDGWRRALLIRWIRNPDGSWAGEVATTDETGAGALYVVAAGNLRPCPTERPAA